jgi:hypothetical protein
MKTIISSKILLLGLALCMAGTVKAQSLYDAAGVKLATKLSKNSFEVTGSTFVVNDGKLIWLFDGQLREDVDVRYYVRENDRITYYNTQGQIAGYYVPSVKRYYRVEAGGHKEDQIALLYEGAIYTIDENPSFRVDDGFDPEFIGFILFFFFMG